MTPLSVLDLSPITTGHSGATALRNSLDLAQLADRLGYTRYWVAEHHNLPSVASSAPDIMIGQIAALTRRMRVGSGGGMLPHHAPPMGAERCKALQWGQRGSRGATACVPAASISDSAARPAPIRSRRSPCGDGRTCATKTI